MSELRGGSTVPRRQLGRQLRELRMNAPMTAKAAAKAMEFSEAKLFRMEAGEQSMTALEVERMCQIYGAEPDLAQSLIGLARETKAKGWWHSYKDVINEDFAVYIGLEEAASELAWYEADLVPGLLQTEDYARQLLTTEPLPASARDPEAIERRIQLRLSRQRVLTRATDPVTLNVVLSEPVITRQIGNRKSMAEQLDHLLEISKLDNVHIKVMPLSHGKHPGIVTGPFVILRFPELARRDPPTVYADSFVGELYWDQPDVIEKYDAAWAKIEKHALGDNPSRDFITTAMKEL